ncbi:MAG TPA: hypothetical protein VI997_07715 [Candidatus Thermoplasmatota archaeon]|nr:hypothetical protein [Candidatus Thermoplasmatota archaeon]
MDDERRTELKCKDCRYWYGAEDDEYGPCQLKNVRGDARFVTFGLHDCDESQALREYDVAPKEGSGAARP